MSDKVTISHGDEHRLYKEVRSEWIYLQVDHAFVEERNGSVTMGIPPNIWAKIVEDYVRLMERSAQ